MKDQENIDREVQETLGVMDDLQRVPGNPYLYTRLKARLSAPAVSVRPGVFAGQSALTALVLALNGVFLYRQWHGAAGRDNLSEALAREWHLNQNADAYFLTFNDR